MPTWVVTIYYLTILYFGKNLNLPPAESHMQKKSICNWQIIKHLQLPDPEFTTTYLLGGLFPGRPKVTTVKGFLGYK